MKVKKYRGGYRNMILTEIAERACADNLVIYHRKNTIQKYGLQVSKKLIKKHDKKITVKDKEQNGGMMRK